MRIINQLLQTTCDVNQPCCPMMCGLVRKRRHCIQRLIQLKPAARTLIWQQQPSSPPSPPPPGLRQRLMLRLTDLPLNSQYRVGLFMNPVPESNVVKTRFLPVSVLIIELKSDDFNFDHTVWSKAPPPSGGVWSGSWITKGVWKFWRKSNKSPAGGEVNLLKPLYSPEQSNDLKWSVDSLGGVWGSSNLPPKLRGLWGREQLG